MTAAWKSYHSHAVCKVAPWNINLAILQAKQGKMEEMTPGQAATLARNEQVIDQATDNLEELEEEMNSSIAETLKGKKRNNPETSASR